jgi:hypothetical protein
MVGIFDTVPALARDDMDWFNPTIGPEIKSGYHALSLDEPREVRCPSGTQNDDLVVDVLLLFQKFQLLLWDKESSMVAQGGEGRADIQQVRRAHNEMRR